MEIRALTVEQVPQAVELSKKVYEIALIRNVSQEMTYYFYDYMRVEKLERRVASGELVIFGAFEQEVLLGVAGVQSPGHLTMLYVDAPYLRHGVAKALLDQTSKYAEEVWKADKITASVFPSYNMELFKKLKFSLGNDFRPGMPYVPMTREFHTGELQIERKKFNWKASFIAAAVTVVFVVVVTTLATVIYFS